MLNTLVILITLGAAAGSARAASIDCNWPVDAPQGTCGTGTTFRCDLDHCCSKYGYCGQGSEYCDTTAGCQSNFGMCGSTQATCSNSSQLATSSSSSASPSKTPVAVKCPKTKGLIANYYQTWADKRLPLYSDLTFYFTAVTNSSGFTLDDDATKALPAFVKAVRKKKSKAILTIGGWTGSVYFSGLVATPNSQKALASSIAAYLKRYSLDGVDLDWEYPNNAGIGCNQYDPQDTANFLSFLQQLRSAVGTKLITGAVPILGLTGPDGAPLKDASGFAQVFDYLTLMNYDVYGNTWSETTGPNAPLYSNCGDQKASAADGLAYWTKAGFPACRLLLGVPSYAYAYTTLSSKLVKTTTPGHQTSYAYQKYSPVVPKGDASDGMGQGGGSGTGDVCPSMAKIKVVASYSGIWTYDSMISGGILSKDGKTGLKGFKRYYDTCSQTPFLFNPKRKYFLSYDDTTSITAKAAFAKSKGMAGLSVFHASGLPSSVYKAMKKNL